MAIRAPDGANKHKLDLQGQGSWILSIAVKPNALEYHEKTLRNINGKDTT